MARVKRGVTAHARHKKILGLAKGYRGRAKNAYRVAIEKVEKGLRYAYRDRRAKKRTFRSLWIQRINAGVRAEGLTYSQFMNGVKRAGLAIDRKVMADLAVREPEAFKAIVAEAQAALKAGTA
jgi:large subunit ribosomal protein L20